MTFLKRFHVRQTCKSNRPIQDFSSDKCGYFCLGLDIYLKRPYDKHRSVDENFNDYLGMFSNNRKGNDQIIMDYVGRFVTVPIGH